MVAMLRHLVQIDGIAQAIPWERTKKAGRTIGERDVIAVFPITVPVAVRPNEFIADYGHLFTFQ
jgi:hypothetical protein